MADVLAGERYVARERYESDSLPSRPQAAQRILIAIIAVLSLVLAGELAYHLVLAPRLVIDTIDLETDLPLTDEEILALAGIRIGTPYFTIEAAAAEANIERHPVVRDAQVRTVFPNRVSIAAVRRQPLAAALAATPEGTVPLVFDEEGVVYQIGIGEGIDLPIVSGLRFQAVDVGLELPQLVVDFLTQLRELKMQSPELYGLFSEYRVVQKNDYAYEVVLYPMHYPLPVRIGTSIDRDMIQYVLMMLDVLNREDRLASLAELDFRGGEGVLRPRASDSTAEPRREPGDSSSRGRSPGGGDG